MEFGIARILFLVALAASLAHSEESVDPFFVPRPDFYRRHDIAWTLADSKEEAEPSSPNLARRVLLDFKNVFTRRENLVVVGVGLGAAWAASSLDETIAESGFNEQVNEQSLVEATFEAGAVLGGTPVQLGGALLPPTVWASFFRSQVSKHSAAT
jgi:hypothetical protein